MPSNAVVTLVDEQSLPIYGGNTASLPSGAATAVLKRSPSRLCRISVTTVGTGTVTFYDNTAGSGLVLYVLPASAPVGVYDIQMPAQVGLTAVSAASSPVVTVVFS